MIRLTFLLLVLLQTPLVFGHKLSDSYLHLNISQGQCAGRIDLALKDLEYAIGLDQNHDLAITWGEMKAKSGEIKTYLKDRLHFVIGHVPAPLEFHDFLTVEHTDGGYAVLRFNLPELAAGQILSVNYSLLFDLDLQHRGLLKVEEGDNIISKIFSPSTQNVEITIGTEGSSSFMAFVKEGIWHIWKGIDHVLFLCALLLPAVLVRREGKWEAANNFQGVLLQVLKVITSFTVAHSITLTLATLGLVEIPARIVEPIIAVSVILAALNNVFGWLREKLWSFAFVFGLIHGFGFAFVLQDLGLDAASLFSSLLGFNLGVEIGQVLIVLVVLPLSFLLRYQRLYRFYFLRYGSILIACIAATWMFERVFTFKILPF